MAIISMNHSSSFSKLLTKRNDTNENIDSTKWLFKIKVMNLLYYQILTFMNPFKMLLN